MKSLQGEKKANCRTSHQPRKGRGRGYLVTLWQPWGPAAYGAGGSRGRHPHPPRKQPLISLLRPDLLSLTSSESTRLLRKAHRFRVDSGPHHRQPQEPGQCLHKTGAQTEKRADGQPGGQQREADGMQPGGPGAREVGGGGAAKHTVLHRQESLPSSAPEVGIRLGPGRRRAFHDQFSLALHLDRPGASTPLANSSRYPFVRKQKQLSLIPVINSRKVRSSDSHLMMADTPTAVQLPPAPPLGTTVPPKPCPKPASGRPGVPLHPCSGPRPANAAPGPRCPRRVLSGVGFSYREVSSQPDPSSACLLSPAVVRHLRWGPQGTLHPTTAHLPVSTEETQQAGQWAGQGSGQGREEGREQGRPCSRQSLTHP